MTPPRVLLPLLLLLPGLVPAATPATRLPPPGVAIPDAARAELTAGAAALGAELAALKRELAARPGGERVESARGEPVESARELAALIPDAEIFHKAVDWALRYDEFFDLKQVAAAHRALATGRERVAALRRGEAPWRHATGLVVRGYRSKVDGSVQPYGLVIPPDLTPGRPRRLMVWLLGRGEKRTELAFIGEREAGPPQLTPCDTVTLIPYGRFCNATKFAGETDVFEALAATRAEQPIDPDRILVAGFSMGGASTWHLATHHAGLWAAAAPGAGFAETAAYAKVFAPGKEPPTAWEQKLWGWYDATAYARNLSHCPTIAYSGEIDPQKQAADVMSAALAQEGLTLPHLIGPGTAHKYHPEVRQDLTARLETLLDRGRDPRPAHLQVTTRTLRYPGASWLRFEGLAEHWSRSDLEGRLRGDTAEVTTRGTTAVRLLLPGLRQVKIDGQEVTLPAASAAETVLHRQDGTWRAGPPPAGLRKRPGLTGPVNDAFLDGFLFVRPTGRAWHPTVGAWATAELERARHLWRALFRGDAPVKDDTAVTAEDLARSHIVLWGDPGSNRLLARLLPDLPLQWDTRTLTFRGERHDAAHHAPILIYPNPLNPAKYVVLNTGMDFRDHAYGSNSLQTPKLPDHAIIDLREPPGARWPGRIVAAGFFDEAWR
jgi:hypothetical protein